MQAYHICRLPLYPFLCRTALFPSLVALALQPVLSRDSPRFAEPHPHAYHIPPPITLALLSLTLAAFQEMYTYCNAVKSGTASPQACPQGAGG